MAASEAALISSASTLGVRVQSVQALRKKIESGFAYSAFERLRAAIDLPAPAVAALVQIPERTLARRKQKGALLPTESERVFRISRVLTKATDLFEGDREGALAWLVAPSRALGGERPIDLARTEVGAREVEDLIGRLEHGVPT